MNSLALAMKARGHEGEPLPTVFGALEQMGAHLRRGQVSLWAGAPGTGKSAVATHIAINADETGQGDRINVLYHSADSDRMTLGSRVAAGITRKHLHTVEEMIGRDDPELWAQVAEATEHVWFDWEVAPTLKDLREELDAYLLVNGLYPDLIVIDNLMNVLVGDQTATDHDAVMEHAQLVARETGAHVMVLAHLVGAYDNGTIRPPRDAVINKISKRPRLMVTLWKPAQGFMGMAVVKNSVGPWDGDGRYWAQVAWYPETSFFGSGTVRDER